MLSCLADSPVLRTRAEEMGNILFDFSFHPFPCNLIAGIMGDLQSYHKLYVMLKKLCHFVFVLI